MQREMRCVSLLLSRSADQHYGKTVNISKWSEQLKILAGDRSVVLRFRKPCSVD